MDFQFSIFSILGIVALYIPGYLFRKFYYSGQFTKQLGFGAFAERFIKNVFLGFFFQACSLSIWIFFGFCKLDIILNNCQEFYHNIANNTLDVRNIDFNGLFIYSISVLFISAISGMLVYKIIRLTKLDLIFPVFRYANKWHYFFRGEELSEIKKYIITGQEVLYAYIDILVESGEDKPKLYSGLLIDYTLSSSTLELDTITINNAQRYSNKQNGFVSIPGDYMIFKNSNIINYNVRFQKIKKSQVNRLLYLKIAIEIIGALLFPFMLFWIPFHFYSKIRWWIILGLFMWIISWILGVATYGLIVKARKKTKDEKIAVWIAVAFTILALIGLSLVLYLPER